MQIDKNALVSLARCKRYHTDTVREALLNLLAPWGGIGFLVKPGQNVLLKPNLLAAARPEEAVTTHPVLISILAKLVQKAGGRVLIGDSPGSDDAKTVYKKTGMLAAAEETGSELIMFDRIYKKDYDRNRGKRGFELTEALNQVDVIINVAKLKTHPLTGLTAAVKNTYGCIAGKKKGRMHYEHPLPDDFSRVLLDVYLAVKPAFSIIDAVIALEGIGPRKGKPRNTGLLMASSNAVALDSVAAEITGFKPNQVTTLNAARERSLFGTNLSELQIVGLTLEESRVSNFDQGTSSAGKIGSLVARYPRAWFRGLRESRRPYPLIDEKICNSCGVCADNCPAQIININEGIPDIDQDCCIRCYCCMEFCPQGAVELA